MPLYPNMGYPERGFSDLCFGERKHMSKSVFSDRYRVFLIYIVDQRKRAGLTQTDLAARLVKPQSFISKSENGERRLDFVEVVEWLTALEIDPVTFVQNVLQDPKFDI